MLPWRKKCGDFRRLNNQHKNTSRLFQWPDLDQMCDFKVSVDDVKLVKGLPKCSGNLDNIGHICVPLSPFEIALAKLRYRYRYRCSPLTHKAEVQASWVIFQILPGHHNQVYYCLIDSLNRTSLVGTALFEEWPLPYQLVMQSPIHLYIEIIL